MTKFIKKAVVVGGSGFIGSHVADQLSDFGYKVTIYDISKSLWLKKNQKFILGNILDKKNLNKAIIGADVVYNFAALADLDIALKKPFETFDINIQGNLNVMEACVKFKVKRFIYASTVYVNSREGGFYRCSKQASESYVEEFQKIYGLNYTILRYGSLYGPRADKSNGLNKIIKSALKKGVVNYIGDKESMRDYIHVDDAASASIHVLTNEFINESVVLTGQEPMRVIDMLKMLAEILDLPKKSVKITKGQVTGHYVRTPYTYRPKFSKKYIPPRHIDLGQGLLQLINELKQENFDN